MGPAVNNNKTWTQILQKTTIFLKGKNKKAVKYLIKKKKKKKKEKKPPLETEQSGSKQSKFDSG